MFMRVKKLQHFLVATIIILNSYSAQAGLFDSVFSGISSITKGTFGVLGSSAKDVNKPVSNDISSNASEVRKAQIVGTTVIAGITGAVAVTAITAATVVGIVAIAHVYNDLGHTVLAAGDNASSNYAVWMKGGLSTRKHKTDKGAGHSSSTKIHTASIGFNKSMDNGNMIGAIYQYSKNTLRSGDDKSSGLTNHFGVNGNVYLTDKIHLIGIGIAGFTNHTGD
ncbi:hypothetical protein OAP56_05000, partial [Rickettsiaceae bacterium]|nr:hypothetical protein [Rickettsiaceae bacterium]